MNSVRIVLVETSHPGNIGSCARAMKTMGFDALYLVNPRCFPHPQAIDLSAGSEDLLEKAVVVDDLAKALTGCGQIFMTSARARSIALPGLTPRQAAEKVVLNIYSSLSPVPTNHTKNHALCEGRGSSAKSIAFVFGRESSGLSNAELLQGHYQIHIPSVDNYSSLNIAQAVQIICYELRISSLSPEAHVATHQDNIASFEATERFFNHLAEVLHEIGFLREVAPRRLMERMRRMYGRIQLEEPEVNLLRGMLKRVQYSLRKRSVLDI